MYYNNTATTVASGYSMPSAVGDAASTPASGSSPSVATMVSSGAEGGVTATATSSAVSATSTSSGSSSSDAGEGEGSDDEDVGGSCPA
jgi:hypothetical protein